MGRIATYIDKGSIALFAQQIVDVLGNVTTVAIHDPDGRLAWAGPDPGDRHLWEVSPFLRERLPGPGFCERLSNKNFAYIFYLGSEDADDPIGTLGVQIDPANPVSFEFAYQQIEPILGCIKRHLAINAELSFVRRMSTEGQKGLQLLVRLDELDGRAGPENILRSILELAAAHFKVEVAAVVIPNLGIREAHPASLLREQSTSKAVTAILGSLITAAKKHRKVLLTEANIKMNAAIGLRSGHPRILCSPIVNAKDEVIGIFVLIGPDRFLKDEVRLARGICAKIHTLMRTADQLSSEHYSRHGLLQHITSVFQRHPERSHALLYLDIDKLHTVNDAFGHMAGDQVIRAVSGIIDELAGKADAISHLSGDRFGLFLRDCDEKKAVEKANLILRILSREKIEFANNVIEMSASIGVALIPDVVFDASAALNTAEIAARSAKDRGGNRVVVFRDVDASIVQRRSDLDQVGCLQSALIRDRFVLYAQPILSLHNNENSLKFEILIRMVDEQEELLPPDKFMSSAERYQMMPAIDRWVIKNTLDLLGSADNMLEVNLASFNINVSAQSLADDGFLEHVETRIAESGVSPDSLCFEITETAAVRNLDRAQRFIRRLGKLGCRLALDDFGTGYCSFAHLKELPVHYVKIDGVFIRDILENPLSEAIVAAMTDIAKVMNSLTVAEHVENDLVIQRLRCHGVDYVQGFGIGKPRPLADVLRDPGSSIMLEDPEKLVGERGRS